MPNDKDKPKLLPICPYCGADPVKLNHQMFSIGDFMGNMLYCENEECRRLFSATLSGLTPTAQARVEKNLREKVPSIINPFTKH